MEKILSPVKRPAGQCQRIPNLLPSTPSRQPISSSFNAQAKRFAAAPTSLKALIIIHGGEGLNDGR